MKRFSSLLLLLGQLSFGAAVARPSETKATRAPEPSTILLMSLPLLAFGAKAFRGKNKS